MSDPKENCPYRDEIAKLKQEIQELREDLRSERCKYSHGLADWCHCGWKRNNDHEHEHHHD